MARVANRPVFPGTSRFSAYMSRVPAMAAPGRIMSRFSAGLYSHSKSHAEMPRNNSFVLIFHSFTKLLLANTVTYVIMRCLVGQTDVLLDAVSLLLIKIYNLRYLLNRTDQLFSVVT